MQKFTQKYTLIQLFEDMPVDYEFSARNWPLHCTVADTFATNWDVPTMTARLGELLKKSSQAQSTALDDAYFGEHGEVQVTLLEKTESLLQLHYDVIALLEQGGWQPNDPQFAKDGFLPHATVQQHARLHMGEEVTFDALTLVDFFPGGDPYLRKVLATIALCGTS